MHDEPPRGSSDPIPPLRVAVFAGLAEAAGARTVEVPWAGGTVADLRAAFAARAPAAAALLARSAVVVAGRHAGDRDAVPAGADVAILPPVSGG
ncbi:MAG: MoaD/ThiS family protein [Planctomycetaceae bacterium]